MKRYYIEAIGADGTKLYASGRCGWLQDCTYAKFFKTIEEAESYMAWRKPHLPCEIKCKEQRVKKRAASPLEQKTTMEGEASNFVYRLGLDKGKHFVFDDFKLIKSIDQLRTSLDRVGKKLQKKFSVKMVARNAAYVVRVK